MKTKQPINVNGKDFLRNEYEYYRWMRENEPICRGRMGRLLKMMMVSKYEDSVDLLKDKRFIRNYGTLTGSKRLAPIPLPKFVHAMAHSMITEDAPNHRRLRNLVHKAFTPRMVTNLEGPIETWTHELLDEAEQMQDGTKGVELFTTYCFPIPITVIAEMLGVPQEDRAVFSQWSATFARSISPLQFARTMIDIRGILKYIRKLIEKRRADPGDDMLTALIQAEDEGEQLNEEELVSMTILLLVAGFETTTNLIANGVYTLLAHPEQLALLRDQPELMDSAIEEILRYTTPVAGTKPNYAAEDLEFKGVFIPKKTIVMPLLASANRDEQEFENPDTFDITRTPNKHIAFGNGIHYCLGAPLARLEGKIALTNIIQRYPNLRLAVDESEVRYIDRPFLHRLEELPVFLN